MKKLLFIYLVFSFFPLFSDIQAPRSQVQNIFFNLPTLETEHLLLTKLTEKQIEEHIAEFFAFFSDKESAHYMARESVDTTVEDTKNRMYRLLERQEKGKPSTWSVLEKAGFKAAGMIPEYYYYRDGYYDRIILYLINNDF